MMENLAIATLLVLAPAPTQPAHACVLAACVKWVGVKASGVRSALSARA